MTSAKQKARVEYLRQVMRDISGVDPLAKSRKREVVAARCIVSHTLITEGLSHTVIGELLGVDRSTIYFYEDRILGYNFGGYEAELDLWSQFKDRIAAPYQENPRLEPVSPVETAEVHSTPQMVVSGEWKDTQKPEK